MARLRERLTVWWFYSWLRARQGCTCGPRDPRVRVVTDRVVECPHGVRWRCDDDPATGGYSWSVSRADA